MSRTELTTLLAVAVGLLVGFFVIAPSDSAAPDTANLQDFGLEDPEPVAQNASARYLFGGDVFWGRQFERRAPSDFSYPFSGLDTLNKDDYDAWIANVECPITDEIVAFELQWEAIQFNCLPEYLPEAAKWFDVVSLANNHTDNVRGVEGLQETRENLEEVGIQHFGHYEPGVLEDLCEVIALPIEVSYSDESSNSAALPVAFCGYHGVFRTFTEEELTYMQNYSEHFITIAMPHAGAEYQPTSDVYRQETYRQMIDLGADAVIGNHPHWVQDTEAYNGKLIVYSMGNFIFDQEFNDEVTRSVLIDMSINTAVDDNLQQHIELAEKCIGFKDKCLKEAQEAGLTKPAVSFSYDIVPTRTVNLVTSYDPTGSDAITDRTNWATTLQNLN